MRGWDAQRVAQAADASLLREPVGAVRDGGPARVVIDSREVGPGDLFVGLPGERVDGGGYASQALRAGAWGVLVAGEHARSAVESLDAGGSRVPNSDRDGDYDDGTSGAVLAHDDPCASLQALARAWREELAANGAKVVAITGSTGKTSTKDITAALLSMHMRTAASPANLNTEIGLPLAILAAPQDTQALVVEMAMRGAGQIAELTEIAKPVVGVIVNVGPAHLELLGSIEAIAAAKAELIAGLAAGATAVVPAGEPLLEPHLRADVETVTFGEGGDVELIERRSDGSVRIRDRSRGSSSSDSGDGDTEIELHPSFAQAHNLRNLLAAVAVVRALKHTPQGRLDVNFSAMRGQRRELPGGVTLIDDCYNANPMSMRAAIDDLAETAPARRVAVLGDMLELGPRSEQLHREMGEHASALGVDLLVAVGPRGAFIEEAFAGESHAVADAEAAAELLPGLLRDGDTVLVKGSRGVGLERVGERLHATLRTPRKGHTTVESII